MAKGCRRSSDLVGDRANVRQGFGNLSACVQPNPSRAQQVKALSRHLPKHPLCSRQRMITAACAPEDKSRHATICPFLDRFSGGVIADCIARSRMRVGLVGDRKALRAGSPTLTCGTGSRSEA